MFFAEHARPVTAQVERADTARPTGQRQGELGLHADRQGRRRECRPAVRVLSRQVRHEHRDPGGMGLQARALTQLHLQPRDRGGVPPGPGQQTCRLRPRHQYQSAPGQGHLIDGEPAEPLQQLARTGRGVLLGDRRHDACPPSVVPHVVSSPPPRRSLGVSFLTVPLEPEPGGQPEAPYPWPRLELVDTWSQPT